MRDNVLVLNGPRRHSYVSLVAETVIAGAGAHGYVLALRYVAHLLREGKR
ncbi:MAG: type II 3-dehydroquinate dehydratase [Streptosporangiaceae bacterium]